MASKLRDIDRGWKKIKHELGNMRGSYVQIGVLSSSPDYIDGTSMAEVAFWNEFGTKRIPERPFIKTTADERAGTYKAFMEQQVVKIFQNRSTVKTSLNKAGVLAQGHVRKKIRDISTPPNAPITIKIKGSSNPLIDTGLLLRSIDYEVRI